MKRVALANGKGFAVIDDDDFKAVTSKKWQLSSNGYVVSGGTVLLHRFLMCPSGSLEVDHKNRNKLDNRRANLRACTHRQNNLNTPASSTNSLGVKGVYLEKRTGKYYSQLRHKKGETLHLGTFNTLKEATLAYNRAAREFYGEFAYLNEMNRGVSL